MYGRSGSTVVVVVDGDGIDGIAWMEGMGVDILSLLLYTDLRWEYGVVRTGCHRCSRPIMS